MTLTDAFEAQADSCESLGSPFMARLMHLLIPLLGPGSVVGDHIRAWPGDISWRGDVVPLRLAGGLHNLILTGRAPDLAAVYPPLEASDADLGRALAGVLETHADFLIAWLKNPPQTNEVRRSAAILPGLSTIAQAHPLPMDLLELGASAGLNLLADRFCVQAGEVTLGDPASSVCLHPDWQGDTPPSPSIHVASRAGVDLTPIDATDRDQRIRLLSYLWPDQPHRADLTDAAADMAGRAGFHVDQGDAAGWLRAKLENRRMGHSCVVFHTIALQYFPPATKAEITNLMEEAGQAATKSTPLAWLGMEADAAAPGAALTLRLWPGDHRLDLGRADFHGRWIDFRAASTD